MNYSRVMLDNAKLQVWLVDEEQLKDRKVRNVAAWFPFAARRCRSVVGELYRIPPRQGVILFRR